MENKTNPQPRTAYFCTYKNGKTNGWQKSREYMSMGQLLSAMTKYLVAYPHTSVTFQTRIVYV